jgi:NADH pyrophosphatase NudC (nudix superfamily)
MTIHMNIAMILMVTLLAGWLMAIAGVQKSALEWRRRRRICPSCGREIRARICTTCTTA